ncbi:ABC transporter substrate-binding protein [Bifidobacterium bombi]|uniref:Sugars ABC transporter, solute-binding protein n=1 Tax=Bifidobacterium bombi DSM 19703 TaxID=1341695 RepID=A0A080N2A4_9BIFI|nr:sugars ABC transporter, solute-binding protein [Bifidobacterium bombi DSM 19703]
MTMRVKLARLTAMVCTVVNLFALSSCQAATDNRTLINVWSWEPSMEAEARVFERENPDIRVKVTEKSGYDNLNTAIQDGYGQPDVVQLEYYALPQYAVSGQIRDITDEASGYSSSFSPGTWSSVQLNNRVYGIPLDSGPMAFFYNKDVFDQAGVDATAIHSWEDYYNAAKKLKSIGAYITADSGDASFYNAMIWLAGGRPFKTSADGHQVTIDLAQDQATRRFTGFWQKMVDEGLVNTTLPTWSDGWKKSVGNGSVASLFAGAWLPSLLLSDLPGTSGLWRVAPMPTPDGRTGNSENGGSSLAILQSSRKPQAAFRFIRYVCHSREGIDRRVEGGAFPADSSSLKSQRFLRKTTLRDARGVEVNYFGGQEFNRVLSRSAADVSVGYTYLPFEVYARSDFRNTVGAAYQWSNKKLAFERTEQRIEEGQMNPDGSPLQLPQNPGAKVSLSDGLEAWQKDLKEYGTNQGFDVR